MSAFAMLDAMLAAASEEELAEEGLFPGDDAAYWAELNGEDAYTWENLMIPGVACAAEAEEAATALVAASATLLAVALLN